MFSSKIRNSETFSKLSLNIWFQSVNLSAICLALSATVNRCPFWGRNITSVTPGPRADETVIQHMFPCDSLAKTSPIFTPDYFKNPTINLKNNQYESLKSSYFLKNIWHVSDASAKNELAINLKKWRMKFFKKKLNFLEIIYMYWQAYWFAIKLHFIGQCRCCCHHALNAFRSIFRDGRLRSGYVFI